MIVRILATALLLYPVTSAFGQDASQEEMMKVWKEVATPGAPHKTLAESVGKWEVSSTAWMAPDQPPTKSKGSAEIEMILGGRFIQQKYKGEMFGQPYNGVGLVGFDNYRKKYVMFWIDDAGTAMYSGEGDMDASGKVVTFMSKMDDPMAGQKDVPVRYVSTMNSKDKQTFEGYYMVGDQEMKMMELVYTRKKK